jgi:hypothetical protein
MGENTFGTWLMGLGLGIFVTAVFLSVASVMNLKDTYEYK